MSYEISLHFPHADYIVEMPAVPRVGERVEFTEADPDTNDTNWTVTEVSHTAYANGIPGTINLTLDPADDHTRKVMQRQEAERIAAARARASAEQ
jgi:hypothetical protein